MRASSGDPGRILDPSGAAVPDARVEITSRATSAVRNAISDHEGSYHIPGLAAGEYLVEAHAPGLGAARVETVELSVDAERETDLRLELPMSSAQVQVTGASTAQSLAEQSKALDIIDAGQLESRKEYSVVESLRLTPGLRVQQLGGPSSFARILSRGMRATDTAILVDGFRLRDAASPQGEASAFLADLLVVAPDRIEVLRGSGSSYGSHATSAVVNLVSDQGGGRNRGEVAAEGGGLGMMRGLARSSGGFWNDRLRYTAGFAHLNLLSGVDGDDRARNTSVQSFVQLNPVPQGTLTGRVLAANSFLQLNDTAYAAPNVPPSTLVPAVPGVTFIVAPNDPDNRRSSDYLIGLVSYLHQWSPAASMRVGYNGVITRRDNRDGPAGTRFEPAFSDSNRFNGTIHTLQARTDLQAGRWNMITAGYEFERESFDNISTDENPDAALRVNARAQIDQSSHALFLQDQLRLLDNRLQVSLSGRTQSFDADAPRFSGSDAPYQNTPPVSPKRAWTGDASAAWLWPSTGTKLRAHVGNGYRAPSLFERYGASFFFGSFSASGDPRLSPERLIALDAGFDQYFAGDRMRVSGSYFYTRIQEAIIFDFSGIINPETDPYGRFGGYRNTAGGLARGFEMSVEANPARAVTLQSSYTYTNADERQSPVSSGDLRSIRIFEHMFTTTGTWRLGRSLDVTGDIFVASDYLFYFGSQMYQFGGPRKVDLAVSYTRPIGDRTQIRLFTRVENVFNTTWYEDGFSVPKAWATVGIKLLF